MKELAINVNIRVCLKTDSGIYWLKTTQLTVRELSQAEVFAKTIMNNILHLIIFVLLISNGCNTDDELIDDS